MADNPASVKLVPSPPGPIPLHLCVRVDYGPAAVASEVRRCAFCGCEVWFDPGSRVFTVERICCYTPDEARPSCFDGFASMLEEQ